MEQPWPEIIWGAGSEQTLSLDNECSSKKYRGRIFVVQTVQALWGMEFDLVL